MSIPPHPAIDPIQYVLMRLWDRVVSQGKDRVIADMIGACEHGDFADAMMFAIALEMDAAKREAHVEFWKWHEQHPTSTLEEMTARQLLHFLTLTRKDLRTLGEQKYPTRTSGSTFFDPKEIDECLGKTLTPPIPIPPPPPPRS